MKFAISRAGLSVSFSVPYSSLNILDYRVFLNNSDVRLDLDSDGSFRLALTIIVTMARDAGEPGDSKLKRPSFLLVSKVANSENKIVVVRQASLPNHRNGP